MPKSTETSTDRPTVESRPRRGGRTKAFLAGLLIGGLGGAGAVAAYEFAHQDPLKYATYQVDTQKNADTSPSTSASSSAVATAIKLAFHSAGPVEISTAAQGAEDYLAHGAVVGLQIPEGMTIENPNCIAEQAGDANASITTGEFDCTASFVPATDNNPPTK